ncbi:MAG: amidohydrolase family protein [Gemmataceae bacterium]
MSHADRIVLRARYVFPVDAAPIADGVLVVEGGCIQSVGPASHISADHDLGNAALLPGFANLHTHLDLTDAAGRCPPSNDFVGWLRKVIAHRRSQTPEDVDRAIAAGIEELVRSGTTIVGDISADGSSWTRLTQAPMRSIVFREILGLSRERATTSLKAADDWYRRSHQTNV